MITFAKFGGDWVLVAADGKMLVPGETVTVTLRDGRTKQVKVGAQVVGWKVEKEGAR